MTARSLSKSSLHSNTRFAVRSIGQRKQRWARTAIALCLSPSLVQAEEYRYPYRDPYLATVTTAILTADGMTPRLKRQAIHVPVLAGRGHLPALEGRGNVSVTLYRQDHPAPLIFVLAGIGSNSYFGLGTYFAGLFHQLS